MSSKLAVIGDIHGELRHAEGALRWALNRAEKIIFVGDYIDRGQDSAAVLNLLIDAKEQLGGRLILLLGNHEYSLLDFLDGGSPDQFLRQGGLATIRSYLPKCVVADNDPLESFRASFPRSHMRLLRSLQIYHEDEDAIVSHAGLNPNRPQSRLVDDLVLRSNWELFQDDISLPKSLVICGHYIQREGVPYVRQDFVCLDTGCGSIQDGRLSVITLPERTIYSTSEVA